MKNIFLVLSVSIITLNSCHKEELNGSIVNNDFLLTTLYSNSIDTINIAGLSVTLIMDVYFAFTPGSIPVEKKQIKE